MQDNLHLIKILGNLFTGLERRIYWWAKEGRLTVFPYPLTFRFPSELTPEASSLTIASFRLRTSSGGVFCFDLKMKFILDDVVSLLRDWRWCFQISRWPLQQHLRADMSSTLQLGEMSAHLSYVSLCKCSRAMFSDFSIAKPHLLQFIM